MSIPEVDDSGPWRVAWVLIQPYSRSSWLSGVAPFASARQHSNFSSLRRPHPQQRAPNCQQHDFANSLIFYTCHCRISRSKARFHVRRPRWD